MYLKRLELQGFKTFASKTEFEFSSGITAIVGPNGSGKSNIADAIRWVLGEQSPRPLRIKRSEDVIFAGTVTRPRVGMAEVSITLDNSTRWLPIDFTEVVLTRRAYRSGDNEYYINKSRVRLRDVVDLLLQANVGQNAYTVIGQGTVDAALSLRPEERRGLFEEAADIKRYQVKRSEALQKLAATEQNITRVTDILAEIAPRVTTLREQAQRAREAEQVAAELRGLLAAWYAHRWNEIKEVLAQAIAREQESQHALAAVQREIDGVTVELQALRREETERRLALGAWHQQSSALHAQADALERRIAVAGAKLDALRRQRSDIEQELTPLRESLLAQDGVIAATEAEHARLQGQHAQRVADLAALQGEAAGLEDRRRQLSDRLLATQNAIFRLGAALADLERRLSFTAQRRAALTQGRQQLRERMATQGNALRLTEERLVKLDETIAALDGEITRLTNQRHALDQRLAHARQFMERAQADLAAARQERAALEAQAATLLRFRETRSGYEASVRHVLDAQLPGIIGVVASLLTIPPDYQAAIDAALGSHAQDIVVESWRAAEDALASLRRSQAGRATFLPLDTLRVNGLPRLVPGMIGRAADLVQCDPRDRPIVIYLLGRIGVVEDLAAARRLLAQAHRRLLPILPHPLTAYEALVTLSGEVVRLDGAVSGGGQSSGTSGIWEREQELSTLPPRVDAAREREEAIVRHLQAVEAKVQAIQAELVAQDQRLGSLRSERDKRVAERAALMAEKVQLEATLASTQARSAEMTQEVQALADQEAALLAEQGKTRMDHEAATREYASLQEELSRIEGAELHSRLAEARTAVALGEQELRSQDFILRSQREARDRLQAQIAAKERRARELEEQAAAIEAELAMAEEELAQRRAQISELGTRIQPAEASLADLESRRGRLLDTEGRLRGQLLDLERRHSQAALEVQKMQDELARLQTQIEAEENLGLQGVGVDDEEVARFLEQAAIPVQLRLDLSERERREASAALQSGAARQGQALTLTPDQLKWRVDRLRAHLRSLGGVNPGVIAEYEEVLQRYTFLTTQSDDLQNAAASLRKVIAELDEIMRRRFEETFAAISREFRNYFTTLFNGGTARLILTDPEDVTQTGVDIIAQPPGKRLQSLSLLSGGERALTAAALLFAILSVNPTPFCVLDEVDAALDEANIGRFTDVLKHLSQQTQFIIITHNRVTMEMAENLYGVSLGPDGTSQVLSLHLDGHKPGNGLYVPSPMPEGLP